MKNLIFSIIILIGLGFLLSFSWEEISYNGIYLYISFTGTIAGLAYFSDSLEKAKNPA